MNEATPALGDIARRGEEIYQERIKALVEPAMLGKYIVIDVDTGQYEIDDVHLNASKRARCHSPATALFGRRVGSRALARTGFLRVL